MKKIKWLLILTILIGFFNGVMAREEIVTLNKKEKSQIVDKASELLDRFYVIPETAGEMIDHLKKLQNKREFKEIEDPQEFAEYLTDELRSICHDRHLKFYLGVNPDQQKTDRNLKRLLRQLRAKSENYGLDKIEVFEGNIGYMNIKSVMYSPEVGERIDAAMTFLADVDALILDQRENGRGGDETFMTHLFSYFFNKPTHINSIYWKDRDRTDEFWTREKVPGMKMSEIPIFVLISKNTFSGAEAFAYELQALKRATVIGEPTVGAANPASTWVLYKNLRISIPFGRAIHPVTQSNWEGSGVKPDIEVPADQALTAALELAGKSAQEFAQKQKKELLNLYMKIKQGLEEGERLFEKNREREGEELIITMLTRAVKHEIMNQSGINAWGYNLLGQEKKKLAVAVFKANTLIFPEEVDVWDSLAESYLESGDKEKAIKYYRKALEINPQYPTALRALKQLEKSKKDK